MNDILKRQSFVYSTTDALVRCLKETILKFTLKQLQHVSMQLHHHQGAHYSCLLKLQLLKWSIKIHRCMVNTVVVWMHILGPYWCMDVALSTTYCRTVQHTYINKDLICAATPPPY
jgi:hypothetical protein